MHNELKKLLHTAKGQSQRVIVVFLDVRGFSSFARIAESTDTAEFLKSAYTQILDDYFSHADFFKPTGDGLLILTEYNRDGLTDAVRTAVATSAKLVEDFPTMCDDDPMVNFDVPTKLGIGLARGSATSLTSEGKVLDFSGRPLNLAARLMDLARPSGVVFDESFGHDLLTEDMQARFSKDDAYVKGLAETRPLVVYSLDGYTEIPEFNKRSMDQYERYTEKTEKLTFKELEERAPKFRHPMMREPARTDNIEMHLEYPAVRSNGSKHPSIMRVGSLPAEYLRVAGKSYAVVDYADKVSQMKSVGVKGTWGVLTTLEYSVADDKEPVE